MSKKLPHAVFAAIVTALIFQTAISFAMFPLRGTVVLKQSDGSSFVAQRKALDNKMWTETESGHVVAYNYDVGNWTYALADEYGFFRPSTLVVGASSPPNLNLTDQEKAAMIMSQAEKAALFSDYGDGTLLSSSQTMGMPVYQHGTGPYAAHDQHPKLNPTSTVCNLVVPVFFRTTEVNRSWDDPSEVNKHEDFSFLFEQADPPPNYRDRDEDGLPDRYESMLYPDFLTEWDDINETYITVPNDDPVWGQRLLFEMRAGDGHGGGDDLDKDPGHDEYAGLTNYEEYIYGTNPRETDTDEDTMNDSWEVNYAQTDPLDAGWRWPAEAIETGTRIYDFVVDYDIEQISITKFTLSETATLVIDFTAGPDIYTDYPSPGYTTVIDTQTSSTIDYDTTTVFTIRPATPNLPPQDLTTITVNVSISNSNMIHKVETAPDGAVTDWTFSSSDTDAYTIGPITTVGLPDPLPDNMGDSEIVDQTNLICYYEAVPVLYFVRQNSDGDTWICENHSGWYGNADYAPFVGNPFGTVPPEPHTAGQTWTLIYMDVDLTKTTRGAEEGFDVLVFGPNEPDPFINGLEYQEFQYDIVNQETFEANIFNTIADFDYYDAERNPVGDGISNAWEMFHFGDLSHCNEEIPEPPVEHKYWGDFDGDDIPDIEEWRCVGGARADHPNTSLGVDAVQGQWPFPNHLDPVDTDSDNDGLMDGYEYKYSMNPFDPSGDNGGYGDLDNDGYLNFMEQYGYRPGGDDRYLREGDEYFEWYCHDEPYDFPDVPRLTTSKTIPHSVKSYFRKVSSNRFNEYYPESYHDRSGQFVFQSKVSPWVRLRYQRAYYAAKPEEMIPEIKAWLRDKRYPLKIFDGNGDGWIDNMIIVHEKMGQELSGDPDDILSQVLVLDVPDSMPSMTLIRDNFDTPVDEELWVQRVTIVPEYVPEYEYVTYSDSDNPDSTGVATETLYPIGPICHMIGYQFDLPKRENGLSTGLPALYDTNLNDPGHSAGIGIWGLMGNGMWNNNGVNPAPPCAWSRYRLGWVDPEIVEMDDSWYWITASKPYPQIQMIKGAGLAEDEFFLLEVKNKITGATFVEEAGITHDYTQISDFELPMPIQSGTFVPEEFGELIILHVDETQGDIYKNDVNQLDEEDPDSRHYRVAVVQADNRYDLENFSLSNGTGNIGDAGDPWPKKYVENSDLEMFWDPFSAPNTDSYYVTDETTGSRQTDVRVSKLQPAKDFEGWDISWSDTWRWVVLDELVINTVLRIDHRWLYYCADDSLPRLIVKHPNGYHTQYPQRSPNGTVYGDFQDIYNEINWHRIGINDIVWDYNDHTGDSVTIELYKDDDYLLTIAQGTANDGFFEWVVSEQQSELMEADTDYLVKISDDSDPSVYDFSDDYFTIDDSQPMIAITNFDDTSVPAMVVADPNYTINWIMNTDLSETETRFVKIELYRYGQWVLTIEESADNTGAYLMSSAIISLLTEAGNGYQFKISLTAVPEVYYFTDVFHLHYQQSTFSDIAIGYNAVHTFFNGTQVETASLLVASDMNPAGQYARTRISWTGNFPDIVELYQNEQPHWLDISGQITFLGPNTFEWEFPTYLSGENFQLKFTNSFDTEDFNFSPPFAIKAPNFIISPNGGDHFNRWDYLPFGHDEYTNNYKEVNIWFGSALHARAPEDPPYTVKLQYADVSVDTPVWITIPGADNIELPAAYDLGDTLICASGNFVWDTTGLNIEKCSIRIVSNNNPFIDEIDTPILIDHNEPEVNEVIVWDTDGNPIDGQNATDVDVTSSIVIKFSEAMDRFDVFFGTFTNLYSWFWSFAMADYELFGGEYGNIYGTVVWENNELRFYPEEKLEPNTQYWVMIQVDARDKHSVGNFIDEQFIFSFTTGDYQEPDTDGDGMPDWYEFENRWPTYQYAYDHTYGYDWFDYQIEGLNPFVADADNDNDGDGLTNNEERLYGTSPIDPNSAFLKIMIEQTADTMIIRWNSKPDPSYKYNVWYADKMVGGALDWKLLEGPLDTTGDWMEAWDSAPMTDPFIKRRIYRVEEFQE